MSGGYLKDGLATGEHMVVIFTLKGPIDQARMDEWNNKISQLKQMLGDKVIGVTIDGENTPAIFKKP